VHRFRRLPPLLRVADILALLFALAGIALLVEAFISTLSTVPPRWPVNTLVIGLNLVLLAGSCSFVDRAYSTRVRQPGGGPSPSLLGSWQGQVRAILLLAALPLCALAVVAFISPTSSASKIVFPVTLIGAFVSFGAHLWLNIGQQAAD
jgi:hypothetical protein